LHDTPHRPPPITVYTSSRWSNWRQTGKSRWPPATAVSGLVVSSVVIWPSILDAGLSMQIATHERYLQIIGIVWTVLDLKLINIVNNNNEFLFGCNQRHIILPYFSTSFLPSFLPSLLTYLFTYLLLTPWCRILFEKLIVTQLIKKYQLSLWNPKVHYRIHKTLS